MFFKTRKMLLIFLSSLAAVSIALVPHNKIVKEYITNNYWYNKSKNEKIVVREQMVSIETLANGEIQETPINNNFELKLILKPGSDVEDTDFFQQINSEFVGKIVNSKLKFSKHIQSRILPIVFFYFENEYDRENFVNKIKDFEEVFQVIVFKNELKFENVWGNDPSFEYYRRTHWYLNLAPTKSLNNFKESISKNLEIVKGQYGAYNTKVGKIGIIEVGKNKYDTKYSEFFRNGIKINENDIAKQLGSDPDYHATIVAMIAGSQFGADKTSSVYLSKFQNHGEWQTVIEKMILDDGVRIINHSYGLDIRKPGYYTLYDEDAYYLDYIARKYGVINFISAGNDGNKQHHQMGSGKLSFNSIVVGALSDKAKVNNVSKNKTAGYTNYKLEKKFSELAKPLLVSPGSFYNPYYETWMNKENYEYRSGTSYATPLVVGVVSSFLKAYPGIDTSEFRIPIIKTILSTSAVTPKLDGLKYKRSGYEEKFGAGTLDGVAMHEAAKNYRTVSVTSDNFNEIVLTSSSIFVDTNQTLKVSSSWLFNAGILKKNKSKLEFYEAVRRQGGHWFTNYDLILEFQNPNGQWEEVKRVDSINSNNELLEYKPTKSGRYRYVIKKYKSVNFSNSVDGLLAVTHVVRND